MDDESGRSDEGAQPKRRPEQGPKGVSHEGNDGSQSRSMHAINMSVRSHYVSSRWRRVASAVFPHDG